VVCEHSDRVLAGFYVMKPMATRLYYGKHLLVAYRVIPLGI
jgi:hypothetical protein